MSASPFLVERAGDIERWTLNDPATRNALSDAMVVGLYEAALRAQKDDSLRVVVLTGAPGAFSAGGSLGHFASAIGQPLQDGETVLDGLRRHGGGRRLLWLLTDGRSLEQPAAPSAADHIVTNPLLRWTWTGPSEEDLIGALGDEYARMRDRDWGGFRGYDRWFAQDINNATLASIGLYSAAKPAFTRLIDTSPDLPAVWATLRELAALPRDERRARLDLPPAKEPTR